MKWTLNEFEGNAPSPATFSMESAIVEAFAKATWKDMSEAQRAEFLRSAKMDNQAMEFGKGIVMSPDLFIDFIREGVRNGISKFIAGTGRIVGATLPFAVYTTASTVVNLAS